MSDDGGDSGPNGRRPDFGVTKIQLPDLPSSEENFEYRDRVFAQVASVRAYLATSRRAAFV